VSISQDGVRFKNGRNRLRDVCETLGVVVVIVVDYLSGRAVEFCHVRE
jgi:hypothetical protein